MKNNHNDQNSIKENIENENSENYNSDNNENSHEISHENNENSHNKNENSHKEKSTEKEIKSTEKDISELDKSNEKEISAKLNIKETDKESDDELNFQYNFIEDENEFGIYIKKKSKRKDLAKDFEITGVSSKVDNYFIKREYKLLEVLGDDQDIYEKVLDLEELAQEESDILRKQKKFAFIDQKPLIDRYKLHNEQVKKVALKNMYKNRLLFNSPLNSKISAKLLPKKKNEQLIIPDLKRNCSLNILKKDYNFNAVKKIIGHEAEMQKSMRGKNEIITLKFIKDPPTKIKNRNNKSFINFVFNKYSKYILNHNSGTIINNCDNVRKSADNLNEIRKINRDCFNKRTKVILKKIEDLNH